MIRLMKKYLAPYKAKVILLFIALTISSLCSMSLPAISKIIINNGVAKQDSELIFKLGAVMIALLLIAMGVMICVNKLSSLISLGFSRDLRHALFKHITKYSQSNFDDMGGSTLISRQINDITQIQAVLTMMFNIFLTGPIMCVCGVVLAYITAPQLSWILFIILPIVLIVMIVVLIKVNPLYRENQKRIDNVNRVTREILKGMRVIRAFNNESREKDRMDSSAEDLMKVAVRANRISVSMMPIITFFVNAANILIVWFGSCYMAEGITTFGDIQAFIQYAAMIMTSFAVGSLMMVSLPRAITSAGRINEVFDKASEIKEAKEEVEIPEEVSIEFKDVSFRYPESDENALSNISFKINMGQTLAIIGGTGSGKTTLLNLISRFYEATQGRILINGVDIRKIKLNKLYSMIGMVPQKSFLFAGTIYENICYGKKDATEEEVQHALDIAQATDFVSKKEYGMYSYIASSGSNVSGGQKQRLAIARAIVRKPKIYLFDDSFSALDFKTDAMLRSALKSETQNAVNVIVAQRVGTIMGADKIIVLEKGAMVGVGTHKELMKTCDVYKEIASTQLSEGGE